MFNDDDDETGAQYLIPSNLHSQASQNYQAVEAGSLIEEIDDEIQKDQQGVSEEGVLHNILSKLERSIINESSGRACKTDGLAFKKFSQLMVSKASSLKDGEENCINLNLFAHCLKDFAMYDNDGDVSHFDNAFTCVGRKLSHLICKTPKFNFPKLCIPLTEDLQTRPKKERAARSQRIIAPTKVIVGMSTQEAKEETANENSVTKELDLVRRHLRAAWKNAQSDSIGYYNFVLHPTNFGESIENMFYVSFLVKDGYIRLTVDPDIGVPYIVKMSRSEKEELSAVDRSRVDTTQFVTKMDYLLWQQLVKRLQITSPLVVR